MKPAARNSLLVVAGLVLFAAVVAALYGPEALRIKSQEEARLFYATHGLLPVVLAALAMGILTAFSPCGWPLIPITAAIIGGRRRPEESPLRGLVRSLVYVQGIGLTLGLLGAAVAGLGANLGAAFSRPWLIGILSVLFILFAFGTLGVYELELPAALRERLEHRRAPGGPDAAGGGAGGGLLGVFGMGAVAGLVASPCAAPLIGAFLVLIAALAGTGVGGSGALLAGLRGFLLMWVFAQGFGLPLIIVGTTGARLAAGRWNQVVRTVLGLLLVGAALYFLHLADVLRFAWLFWTAAGLTLAVTLFVLAVGERRAAERPALARLRRGAVLGLAGLLLAGSLGLGLGRPTNGVGGESLAAALARAQVEKKPVLIDFGAGWCTYCKDLDEKVFPEPRVAAELERFVVVRLDFDRDLAAVTTYGVRGVPTLILLDSSGAVTETIATFVTADELLERLKRVR